MQRESDRWVSIALSVLLHGALLAALVYGWLMFRQPPRPAPTLAIEATVVDARAVRGALRAPPPPAPPPPPARPPGAARAAAGAGRTTATDAGGTGAPRAAAATGGSSGGGRAPRRRAKGGGTAGRAGET